MVYYDANGRPFERVRVDPEQARVLWAALFQHRSDLIGERLEARDKGKNEEAERLKHDLAVLKRLQEEVKRALDELR